MGKQRISLKDAEALAREATRNALELHPRQSWFADPNLTLGTFFPSEDCYEFSLYLAAATPQDGIVLTSAVVNRLTGEVQVEIHPDAIRNESDPSNE